MYQYRSKLKNAVLLLNVNVLIHSSSLINLILMIGKSWKMTKLFTTKTQSKSMMTPITTTTTMLITVDTDSTILTTEKIWNISNHQLIMTQIMTVTGMILTTGAILMTMETLSQRLTWRILMRIGLKRIGLSMTTPSYFIQMTTISRMSGRKKVFFKEPLTGGLQYESKAPQEFEILEHI